MYSVFLLNCLFCLNIWTHTFYHKGSWFIHVIHETQNTWCNYVRRINVWFAVVEWNIYLSSLTTIFPCISCNEVRSDHKNNVYIYYLWEYILFNYDFTWYNNHNVIKDVIWNLVKLIKFMEYILQVYVTVPRKIITK